jgi:hypothetical protein
VAGTPFALKVKIHNEVKAAICLREFSRLTNGVCQSMLVAGQLLLVLLRWATPSQRKIAVKEFPLCLQMGNRWATMVAYAQSSFEFLTVSPE